MSANPSKSAAPTKVAAKRRPTVATKGTATKGTATRRIGISKKAAPQAATAPGAKPSPRAGSAPRSPSAGSSSSTSIEVVTGPPPRVRNRRIRDAAPPPPPGVTVPVTGWVVPLPAANSVPWIAGLALVAALEIIDWPVAVLLAVGHTIMTNSKNKELRELAEGIESAL